MDRLKQKHASHVHCGKPKARVKRRCIYMSGAIGIVRPCSEKLFTQKIGRRLTILSRQHAEQSNQHESERCAQTSWSKAIDAGPYNRRCFNHFLIFLSTMESSLLRTLIKSTQAISMRLRPLNDA